MGNAKKDWFENMKACRFCGCQGLWKIGTSTGKQRYKCKNCGKSQAEVDDRVKFRRLRISQNCSDYEGVFW